MQASISSQRLVLEMLMCTIRYRSSLRPAIPNSVQWHLFSRKKRIKTWSVGLSSAYQFWGIAKRPQGNKQPTHALPLYRRPLLNRVGRIQASESVFNAAWPFLVEKWRFSELGQSTKRFVTNMSSLHQPPLWPAMNHGKDNTKILDKLINSNNYPCCNLKFRLSGKSMGQRRLLQN